MVNRDMLIGFLVVAVPGTLLLIGAKMDLNPKIPIVAIEQPNPMPITSLFLDALEHVESGRDVNVKPGDGGRAVGVLQIHRIYVEEANRIAGHHEGYDWIPVFEPADRKDPVSARAMAKLVLDFWSKFHARKGHKIGYKELCSMHRHQWDWKPENLDSELEKGRTKKLLTYMKLNQ